MAHIMKLIDLEANGDKEYVSLLCLKTIKEVPAWTKEFEKFYKPSCESNWFCLAFATSTGPFQRRTGICTEPMNIE